MWWAKEAHEAGHEVKILLEGLSTRCVTWLSNPELQDFSEAFNEAKKLGLLAGVCQAAASGCAGEAGKEKPIEAAKAHGLEMKNSLKGHAGLAEFLNKGFEVITF